MHTSSLPFFTGTSSRVRRGFTLIELLTVIAIIGILAAILIPTVGAVRKRAASVRSVSNLKQIGSAFLLFANENKNQFPSCNNGSRSWDNYLSPYLYQSGNVSRNAENLMMHPRDERSGGTVGMRRTYAANSNAIPRNTSALTPVSRFVSPSRLILVTERPCGGANAGESSFCNTEPTGFSRQMRDIPAGFELNSTYDTFHYLFVDGHVKSLRWGDTVPTGTSEVDAGGRSYVGTATANLWLNQ